MNQMSAEEAVQNAEDFLRYAAVTYEAHGVINDLIGVCNRQKRLLAKIRKKETGTGGGEL